MLNSENSELKAELHISYMHLVRIGFVRDKAAVTLGVRVTCPAAGL